MAHSQEFLWQMVNSLYDGVYCVDNDRNIIFWNPSAERLTGFSREEVLGRCCSENILRHVDDAGTELCIGLCPLAKTMAENHSRESSIYLHHKEGHRVPVSVRCAALTNEKGEVVGGVEIFSDASLFDTMASKVKELEKLAYLDHLTEVANRRYSDIFLIQRQQEFERYQWPFGVLLFDIDRFKSVNDTHGHDVGDRVLKMVARTLAINTRTFDLIGRWGGEEFFGIFRNIDEKLLAEIAERYRMLVEKSFIELGKEPLSVTVSIGATLMKKDDTLETLVNRVDHLLYASKEGGRNRVTQG